MSDRIRLSLWFEGQTKAQMLPRLALAAETLPQEAVERGVQQFAVTAVDWSEAPLLDERAKPGVVISDAVEAMREFAQEDCACEIEMTWSLWTYAGGKWNQSPQPLRLTSMGGQFGDASIRDEGDLIVDFGMDEAFLAELAPWNRETRQHLQANIVQLLVYSRRLEERLKPVQRRLWSEDEEGDWTEKLKQRLEMASSEAGEGSERLVQ